MNTRGERPIMLGLDPLLRDVRTTGGQVGRVFYFVLAGLAALLSWLVLSIDFEIHGVLLDFIVRVIFVILLWVPALFVATVVGMIERGARQRQELLDEMLPPTPPPPRYPQRWFFRQG